MRAKALAALACWLLLSCDSGRNTPLRSPALDYQAPAPRSADGDTIGADQSAPADKLGQGPTSSGPAPGWSADKAGPTYNPKKRVGGAVDPPAAESGASQK